jgi:hypothetical protein
MTRTRLVSVLATTVIAIQLAAVGILSSTQVNRSLYFPSRDKWERREPADVGMDSAKLNDAIEFMKAHETVSPLETFPTRKLSLESFLDRFPQSVAPPMV